MVLWADTCVPGNNIAGVKMPGTGLIGRCFVPRSRNDYSTGIGSRCSRVCVWKMDNNNKYPMVNTQADIEAKKDLLVGNPTTWRYYMNTLGNGGYGNSWVSIATDDIITVVIKSKASRWGTITPVFVYQVKAKANGLLICQQFIGVSSHSTNDLNLYFVADVAHINAAAVKSVFDVIFDSTTWQAKKYVKDGSKIVEDDTGVFAPTPGDMDLDGGDSAHMIFCKKDITFANASNLTWKMVIDPAFIKDQQVVEYEAVEK